MKILITTLLTLLSLNAFAYFESIKATLDGLIISDSGSDEFTLGYSSFDQSEDGYNETAPIVAHILQEKFVDGLLGMDLTEAYNKKEALKIFGSDNPNFGQDYYCYRLVQNFDYGNEGEIECKEKLNKILDAVFLDNEIDAISVLKLTGDYYGDWETIFLIIQNYDNNSSLIVEFDILHEI